MSFLVGPTGEISLPELEEQEQVSPFFWGAEQSKNETDQMIVLEWLFLTIAPCDAAEPWQLGSQDAATPMMQGIIDLHHDIFFFLILIFGFHLTDLGSCFMASQKEKKSNPAKDCSWNYYRDSSDHIS
ncbi:hypothetical protein R6Q57_007076 [Mikania cordata]